MNAPPVTIASPYFAASLPINPADDIGSSLLPTAKIPIEVFRYIYKHIDLKCAAGAYMPCAHRVIIYILSHLWSIPHRHYRHFLVIIRFGIGIILAGARKSFLISHFILALSSGSLFLSPWTLSLSCSLSFALSFLPATASARSNHQHQHERRYRMNSGIIAPDCAETYVEF